MLPPDVPDEADERPASDAADRTNENVAIASARTGCIRLTPLELEHRPPGALLPAV
jgi:hypothetical protein